VFELIRHRQSWRLALGHFPRKLQVGLISLMLGVSLKVSVMGLGTSLVQGQLSLPETTRFHLQLLEILLASKVLNGSLAEIDSVSIPCLIDFQHVVVGLESNGTGLRQFVEGVLLHLLSHPESVGEGQDFEITRDLDVFQLVDFLRNFSLFALIEFKLGVTIAKPLLQVHHVAHSRRQVVVMKHLAQPLPVINGFGSQDAHRLGVVHFFFLKFGLYDLKYTFACFLIANFVQIAYLGFFVS